MLLLLHVQRGSASSRPLLCLLLVRLCYISFLHEYVRRGCQKLFTIQQELDFSRRDDSISPSHFRMFNPIVSINLPPSSCCGSSVLLSCHAHPLISHDALLLSPILLAFCITNSPDGVVVSCVLWLVASSSRPSALRFFFSTGFHVDTRRQQE